ncbi:oxaloacetate decarboxylase [Halomarina halobia]|uniref:Oxaloacetate decarboxylase n=1 Tax=Halomarina halobia TaxID=3033386 RepID=A0ABD6AG31_9EURY|nr:isocitrate lyase/PEP mutase family protein [Halomarina sp. PSR21]
MDSGSRLRALIRDDDILVCPGAHDPMTAMAIERAGFDAVYMTGYGTSLSRAGVPDAGLITMPEMVANANAVQEAVDVPVLGDADNGYGNATNVVRTVREYIKTGVGGIHIEDQSFPKRCGHVGGRRVISRDEAVGKFRAAADVRDDRDEDFYIVARTDARGAVGGSLEEAVERANAYCDAGADAAFVEGLADEEEVARASEAVDAPLLYNLAGISPRLDPEELEVLGYDLVIYPGLAMQATVTAVYNYASKLDTAGTEAFVEIEEAFEGLPFGFHEFSGFPEIVEQEERYMPAGETEKYDGTLGADVREK